MQQKGSSPCTLHLRFQMIQSHEFWALVIISDNYTNRIHRGGSRTTANLTEESVFRRFNGNMIMNPLRTLSSVDCLFFRTCILTFNICTVNCSIKDYVLRLFIKKSEFHRELKCTNLWFFSIIFSQNYDVPLKFTMFEVSMRRMAFPR